MSTTFWIILAPLALLALLLAYFAIVCLFSGFAALTLLSAQGGPLILALYIAAWVFFFPAMPIVCLIFGFVLAIG